MHHGPPVAGIDRVAGQLAWVVEQSLAIDPRDDLIALGEAMRM
jgi:hypothetical protein